MNFYNDILRLLLILKIAIHDFKFNLKREFLCQLIVQRLRNHNDIEHFF